MKQIIVTLLILITYSLTINGQDFSYTVDSLTTNYIKSLPSNQQKYFVGILENRKKLEWLLRVDTTSFDYAFIEERLCYNDTFLTITERYFINTDSLPQSVFVNGKPEDVKIMYSGFLIWYSKELKHATTLFPLIKSYSNAMPIQELPYNSTQIWPHGCVVQKNAEKKFVKERTKQLKATYQIQTMVDRLNSKIIVSIQVAPKRPKFKAQGYNVAGAW